jgi:hypothetical protein
VLDAFFEKGVLLIHLLNLILTNKYHNNLMKNDQLEQEEVVQDWLTKR